MLENLSPLDWVALGLFLVLSLGYHALYAHLARRRPLDTVAGKVALYRRTWVKRVIDQQNHTMAVQAIRNLLMTSSFMASSALLVMAVILQFRFSQRPEPMLQLQMDILVGLFAFAFLSFLFGIRYLNQLTVLIGADPDLISHVEPVDAVTYLSNLLNRANNRFTYGQRAFYFSVPVIAWTFSPVWMIVVEVGLGLYLLGFVDFRKWRHPLDEQQQTKERETRAAAAAAAAKGPTQSGR